MQLEKKATVDKAGKEPKFTATFTGTIEGFSATLTLESETERDMRGRIPLIFDKILEVKIIDPQKKLDDFVEQKDPAIVEDTCFGFPVDKPVKEGFCLDCGLEMWVYPEDDSPRCTECQEIIEEAVKDEEKKESLQKIAKKTEEKKLTVGVSSSNKPLIIEDENEAFREERRKRAAAKEVSA